MFNIDDTTQMGKDDMEKWLKEMRKQCSEASLHALNVVQAIDNIDDFDTVTADVEFIDTLVINLAELVHRVQPIALVLHETHQTIMQDIEEKVSPTLSDKQVNTIN